MQVVIMLAVHNGEGTLAACVESILNQTWSDWTLCVVDDGSTDHTYGVLRKFQRHPRIRISRQQRKLGLAVSLNRIWRGFPAKLYARIDADDTCFPDRLAIQCQFMERHPDVSVLGGGAQIVGEDGSLLGTAYRPVYHEQLAANILRENPFIHPTVMMRREFLERLGGYDEGLRRAQDHDLWLRGVKEFRYHNLPTPLIRYRLTAHPSWQSIYWGAVVLARAVRQQKLGLWGYRFPLRFILGNLLVKSGWRRHALLRKGTAPAPLYEARRVA